MCFLPSLPKDWATISLFLYAVLLRHCCVNMGANADSSKVPTEQLNGKAGVDQIQAEDQSANYA